MKNARGERGLSIAAHGFERYAFGPKFVLGSSSWKEAEKKIAEFLSRRAENSPEVSESYYSAGCEGLWREYQLLFMCQLVEFRVAEVIGQLRARGFLKPDFISKLMTNPRADPERARDAGRIVSPASLLVDLGLSLGQLVNVLRDQTLRFAWKSQLVKKLDHFNRCRIAFVHHSFNGQEKTGYRSTRALITATIRCGDQALRLFEKVAYRHLSSRRRGSAKSLRKLYLTA